MTTETPDMLIQRRALAVLRRRFAAARVVVVNGPRQSGKTALLGMLHREVGGTYVSLDDAPDLRLARTDPAGFVSGYTEPMLIDEIQRGGDRLVLAIKSATDRTQRKSRFVLAGSTRFLTEPRLTESLAGRVRFVDLWPLSQGEIDGAPDGFVDAAFTEPERVGRSSVGEVDRRSVMRRVVRGGLPEAVQMEHVRDRREFLVDYARTLATKDVREIADLEHAADLERIIRLLAARTSAELNVADIARAIERPVNTMRRYLPLFETTYVHYSVPAWSRNNSAKVVKRPKIHLVDSGLAAGLIGTDAEGLSHPASSSSGPLLETFVAGEIARQLTWSATEATLFHWRDRDGAEVDLVLETPDGHVVGIEVKASVDSSPDDFAGLRRLRDRLGSQFVAGFLIHCGERSRPAGERLWSVPVAALWETPA